MVALYGARHLASHTKVGQINPFRWIRPNQQLQMFLVEFNQQLDALTMLNYDESKTGEVNLA